MKRREAIAAVLALGSAPFVVQAQPAGKIWRIGYLSVSSRMSVYVDSFRQGMRELGYVEGRNITIDYRFADLNRDRLAADAADLVRRKVDLIVASTTQSALAAKKETSIIPIVVVVSGDAVGTGLVKSLARPGGNVTGQTLIAPEVGGKRLQLLKAALPAMTRVGILWNPKRMPVHEIEFRDTETAAQRLGLRLIPAEVSAVANLRAGFAVLSEARAEALIAFLDPFTIGERARVADLAIKARLPLMAAEAEITKAGALMSYGPNLPALFRHPATYVDKILKGAKPADLPVEQPTEFELVVNMKTAKALGVTLPQSLLLRADRVIE